LATRELTVVLAQFGLLLGHLLKEQVMKLARTYPEVIESAIS
jgi:hypothetical protein